MRKMERNLTGKIEGMNEKHPHKPPLRRRGTSLEGWIVVMDCSGTFSKSIT